MPLTTTTEETRKIIGGVQCLSRFYPQGCPLKEGEEVLLVFERPDRTMQPYARARVMAIQPLPMAMRMDNGRMSTDLAQGEGFATTEAWKAHFSEQYGSMADGKEVHRLQLSIQMLDQAGGGKHSGQPPREISEDDIPDVNQVQVQTKQGETKTVGSIDNLDAVADLEKSMFGG